MKLDAVYYLPSTFCHHIDDYDCKTPVNDLLKKQIHCLRHHINHSDELTNELVIIIIITSGTDMASACISFSLPIMSLMLLMILLTSGPHLLELSLIWNLLELVDGRCFFRQSTLERDVMENTVQAGTPAKVSKCDIEQDIE